MSPTKRRKHDPFTAETRKECACFFLFFFWQRLPYSDTSASMTGRLRFYRAEINLGKSAWLIAQIRVVLRSESGEYFSPEWFVRFEKRDAPRARARANTYFFYFKFLKVKSRSKRMESASIFTLRAIVKRLLPKITRMQMFCTNLEWNPTPYKRKFRSLRVDMLLWRCSIPEFQNGLNTFHFKKFKVYIKLSSLFFSKL